MCGSSVSTTAHYTKPGQAFWRQASCENPTNTPKTPMLTTFWSFSLNPVLLWSPPSWSNHKFDSMSSMSRFAVKDFKVRTCDAFCRPSSSLSARRLQTHLGTCDSIHAWFQCLFFLASGFIGFWQLGSVSFVVLFIKFCALGLQIYSISCSHFVGTLTFLLFPSVSNICFLTLIVV